MANRQGPSTETLREVLRRGDPLADGDALSPTEVLQMQQRIAAEAREAPARNIRSASVSALVPALAGAMVVVVAVIAWRALSGPGGGQAGGPASDASTPLVAYRLPVATSGLPSVPPGAAAVPRSPAIAAHASRVAAISVAQGFSPASRAAHPAAAVGQGFSASRSAQPAAAVEQGFSPAARAAQPAAAVGQGFSPASEGDRPRQLQFVTAGGTRIVWVLSPQVRF